MGLVLEPGQLQVQAQVTAAEVVRELAREPAREWQQGLEQAQLVGAEAVAAEALVQPPATLAMALVVELVVVLGQALEAAPVLAAALGLVLVAVPGEAPVLGMAVVGLVVEQVQVETIRTEAEMETCGLDLKETEGILWKVMKSHLHFHRCFGCQLAEKQFLS